jgi:hypothetical protein
MSVSIMGVNQIHTRGRPQQSNGAQCLNINLLRRCRQHEWRAGRRQ